jgi:hypothetical protein
MHQILLAGSRASLIGLTVAQYLPPKAAAGLALIAESCFGAMV